MFEMMKTLTVGDTTFEIVDEKARTNKIDLPTDSEGNVDYGTADQALLSNGDGTYRWGVVNTSSGSSSGSPITINVASDMKDTTQIYLYVGNEEGYTSGHWYYYDGTAWVSGGLYGNTISAEIVAEAVEKYLKEHGIQSSSSARIGEVTLTASGWVGNVSPYSQVVTITGVTENSQVDLTPNIQQLAVFYEKDLAFVTENEGGIVTVYAIGQKPSNDYTIQVTITEVL